MYCDGGAYLQVEKNGFYLSYEDPDAGTPALAAGFYQHMDWLKVKIIKGKKAYMLIVQNGVFAFEPCWREEIQP